MADKHDDDRDSGPDSPRGPLPLTIFAATAWALGAKFLLILAISILLSVRPTAKNDLVSASACDAVAFLLSERAGYISGDVLHVSGGRY